ncbi:unnamed protein product [Diplocarpon coronariae]
MSTPKNINFKPPADPLPESFQARPSHSEIDSDSENSLEHLGPCIRPGSPPVETNKAIMAAFKAITNHFPLPGSPGAPYFTGANITDFLEQYEETFERGRLFLLGLPTGLRNKIIKHFKVDERDPVTYAQFEDFSTFALKADLSERTIEAMEKEKEPTSSFTKDLKSLVQEHSKALEEEDISLRGSISLLVIFKRSI